MEIDIPTTLAQDLRGHQYKAIAIGGTLAVDSPQSSGLIQTHTDSGEDGAHRPFGRSRFIAGGAVALGNRLLVTSGGWLVAAASGDTSVGFAEAAVTSGSVGRGVFNFVTPYYHIDSNTA